VSQHNAENIYGILASYSTTITSFALSSGNEMPFVTVPHYEVRGQHFKSVSDAQLIAYSPVVSEENLELWNGYSVENQGWVQESYVLRGDEDHTAKPIQPFIYRKNSAGQEVREIGRGEYSPLWQQAEVPNDDSIINFNLLSHGIYHKVFNFARATKTAILSQVFDPSVLFGEESLLKVDGEEFHPESILIQPVYDGFDANTSKVVGAVIAVLPWDHYFENLLHEGANGVICVLKDTCGDAFTYRIDGAHASYLGEGDLHESQYDHLERTVLFTPFHDFRGATEKEKNSHCEYDMHIYPSSELEEGYHTSKPAVFTTAVVLVFFFTTLVFLAYDFLVQKRQEKVHSAAVKSNAIVSSLFPAEIRDRLFQHNEEPALKGSKGNKNKGGLLDSAPNKFRLKNYLDADDVEEATPDLDMYDTKPIADLFPNTTVMFADIAGFTAWSSVREPSQVFTLLEAVYRAFDTIAKRRRGMYWWMLK
jgi:hypothetical protein